ncbi:MAG TPA: VWA domain-containing protein [Planctomycetaceae bacterium]|nr:VWA domain-containing protein [Planctomycetaceae bacterium]
MKALVTVVLGGGLACFIAGCSAGDSGEAPASSGRAAADHPASLAMAPRAAPAGAALPFPAVAPQERELDPAVNSERYNTIVENRFVDARQQPVSTFSIDVDTASYANVRRFLEHGQLPPADAVRIEELVNYFDYAYPPPTGDVPFSVNVEIAGCPWQPEHALARIGLKGREMADADRPSSNLVFLLDVSGSMSDPDKLPLVKSALKLLVDRLGENDRVSIVVYAGASGLVLPATPADRKQTILAALEDLRAGGSTDGGSGIQLAYQTAVANFIRGGTNRVILCTDGDFNVGVTSQAELVRLIEDQARSGVFLSVFGFGRGNLQDGTLEQLADRGNGSYGYIDTPAEARKVFVEELTGTLVTIARDVKIQIAFNPARVAAYRLIGYENRLLRNEDFRDDAKDAGEIGAGHTVTALYQIVPVGEESRPAGIALAGLERPADAVDLPGDRDDLLTLALRYKLPADSESSEFRFPVLAADRPFSEASGDFRFAAAVAQFGLLLRDSEYSGSGSFETVLETAAGAAGPDRNGYRAEFLRLVRRAAELRR